MNRRIFLKHLILFSLLVLVIFLPFILGYLHYSGYDINNEYVYFMQELRNNILKGKLVFWSYDSFLGNNIWASKSFYYIGDIFSYIGALMIFFDAVTALCVTHIIKIIFGFSLFYYFLYTLKCKQHTCFIFSLIYCLSSWTLIFYGQPMFLTFYYFLPILFIAVEKYLLRKNILLIYLSGFILVASNFYLFYSVSLFLLFYWIIRYYINEETNFKTFIFRSMYPIMIYCLGALSFSFILIPTIGLLKSNPRVTTQNMQLFFNNPNVYLNILNSMISKASNISNSNRLFSSDFYALDQIGIYSSALILVFFPCFISKQKKLTKRIIKISFIVILLIIFSAFGNSMMHGFSEPSFRWTFNLQVCLIIMAAISYDRNFFDFKIVSKSFLVLVAISFLLFINLKTLKINLDVLLIFASIVFFILFFYFRENKRIITLLVIIETIPIFVYGVFTYSQKYGRNEIIEKTLFKNTDTLEILKKNDDFYRIDFSFYHSDINFEKEFRYNIGLYYGFHTTMGYESTYHPNVKRFLTINNHNFWWHHIIAYEGKRLVSTKYYVVKDEAELQRTGMKYVGKLGNSDFKIYEDPNYLPFGSTYDQIVDEKELYNNYDMYGHLSIMNEKLSVLSNSKAKSLPIEKGKRSHLKDIKVYDDYIEGSLDVESNQMLFISFPFDSGWNFYIDGIKTEVYMANASFMSIYVPKGKHFIQMQYKQPGLKKGVALSLSCFLFFILILLFKKRIDEKMAYFERTYVCKKN